MADQDAEIRKLAEAGRKIEAIKLYRERHGGSLAEAKQIVDAMEDGQSPVPDGPPSLIYSIGQPSPPDAQGDADLRALAASGETVRAIQMYRLRYGVGLAEAKRAVDSLVAGRASTSSTAAPRIPSEEEALALPEAEFLAAVDGLIRARQKIQAIKIYRARYGFGLKETKDFIDAWERRGTPPDSPLPAPLAASPEGGLPPPSEYNASIDALARRDDAIRSESDEEFAAAIDAQVNARNKLEAMRLYRLRYSVSLKQAKDAIDAWERGVRVLPASAAPAPVLSPRLAADAQASAARVIGESTAEPCEGHIDERNLGQGIDLALQMGRREEAVQLYQERAGVSRREAEATIAAREKQLGSTEPAKSGCFIATAAFGAEQAPEVAALRRFRDTVLAQSGAGRRFIRWYYRWSPSMAERLARQPLLCALVRWGLRPLARFCGCGRN